MTRTSIAAAFVTSLCALGANPAPAQTVCELIPRSAWKQVLTPQCWRTSEVSGSVLGVNLSRGAVSISLSGLSFDRSFDVGVDDFGQFSLSSVPAGDYLLLVRQGGSILGFNEVVVPPGTSQLIFQLSNQERIIGPGPLRPAQISKQFGEGTFPWGLADWPRLDGPRCVRSRCYVDATDEVNQ